MAATLEELQALEEAIRLGVRKVKYADRETEYRSVAEMRSIRDEMRAELGTAQARRPSRRVGRYSKGV